VVVDISQFLMAFSTLVLKSSFSQSFPKFPIAIYIPSPGWFTGIMTTRCLAVTGGVSVGVYCRIKPAQLAFRHAMIYLPILYPYSLTYRAGAPSPPRCAVVTCEIKHWNNFEIMSEFCFTRNHVWNWNIKLFQPLGSSKIISKLFQRQWRRRKIILFHV